VSATPSGIERRGAEVVDYKHARTEGRVSGPASDHKGYGSFASFSGPDGNGSLLQEITPRLPGR
jgi:hypothetical protein